jgi:endoglucanase
MDYLLGQNALSQCYVTGFGEKTILYPHHRPSVADKVRDPIPGMVSGGPNSNMQDTVAKMYFDSDTPPALCFVDETAAYSLNEVTTYWNSSALFLAAGLISHK